MTTTNSCQQIELANLTFSVPPLRDVNREACPQCQRIIWAYCPECLCPAPSITHHLPQPVKLPCRLSVVLHPQESRKKSSLLPGAVLSPDIELIRLEETDKTALEQRFNNNTKAVLLFPDECSINTDSIDWNQVTEVVAIDATWAQARAIRKTILPDMQTCKLQNYRTSFWRYNNLAKFASDECLSTIEALYYLSSEIATTSNEVEAYRLTDLLFLYEAQWHMIQIQKGHCDTLELGKAVRERKRQKRQCNFPEENNEG